MLYSRAAMEALHSLDEVADADDSDDFVAYEVFNADSDARRGVEMWLPILADALRHALNNEDLYREVETELS